MSKVTVAIILILNLFLISLAAIRPLSAAVSGNHLVFKGGTIRANIQNPGATNQFAAEVWIKPTSVSGIRHILTVSDTSNQINYQISINGSGLSLFYRFGNFSQRSIVSGNLENNVWQKVSVSIDSTATKMYINDTKTAEYSGTNQLKPVGEIIILGSGFLGDMDEFKLVNNQANYINWKFDQNRGEVTAADSSGNNITGILNGGDLKIHYFGVLPTPTKFILPTLPDIRRITFSPPQPTNTTGPQPTIGFDFGFNRSIRPQIPR